MISSLMNALLVVIMLISVQTLPQRISSNVSLTTILLIITIPTVHQLVCTSQQPTLKPTLNSSMSSKNGLRMSPHKVITTLSLCSKSLHGWKHQLSLQEWKSKCDVKGIPYCSLPNPCEYEVRGLFPT